MNDQQFGAFAAARGPALRRSAFMLTHDWQHAEDLVQTALLKTWSALRRPSDPDELERYIRKVVYTSYVSWWRRRSSHETATAEVQVTAVEHDQGSLVHRGELWELLLQLPRQQRAVLVLRYYEHLNEAEVADVLGCSRGAVKTHSSRAIARLRAALLPVVQATTSEEQPHV